MLPLDYGTFMVVVAACLLAGSLGGIVTLACVRRTVQRYRVEAAAYRHVARHVVAITLRCPRCLKHTVTITGVDEEVGNVSVCAICRTSPKPVRK